jgi:hypothetical protein
MKTILERYNGVHKKDDLVGFIDAQLELSNEQIHALSQHTQSPT